MSLNSLWRAVGSPDGHDPERWAELAGPLLAGFSELSRPAREHRRLVVRLQRGVLWTWEDESKDPWRTGDLMSHELIAWVYASHLDSRRERRADRLSDSLAAG